MKWMFMAMGGVAIVAPEGHFYLQGTDSHEMGGTKAGEAISRHGRTLMLRMVHSGENRGI